MTMVFVGIDLAKNVFALHGVDEAADALTGQTGSGQARLTPGGAARPQPRDRNGAPLSGSHLGPQLSTAIRASPLQQGRLSSGSLFSVQPLQRSSAAQETRYRKERTDADWLTAREVPVRG